VDEHNRRGGQEERTASDVDGGKEQLGRVKAVCYTALNGN